MKIIQCASPVFTDHFTYKPYVRYICSDYEAIYLTNNATNTEWQVSSFNPYERRYGGQNLNGKKIAIYRHTAFGDQLMISAVPRYLKSKYPEAVVHLYCDPGIIGMWRGNPFVENSAIPIPIPFDVAIHYDYHAFYEGMLENNWEMEQNNCYDDYFGMIGCPDVPNSFKRPHIQPRPEDYKWLDDADIDLDRQYIVYHLSPANKNRAYPISQGMEFVEMAINDGLNVIVVGKTRDGNEAVEYHEAKKASSLEDDGGKFIDLVGETESFRQLIPIVEKASAVVCPDSAVLHLAGAMPDVPIVSLWGLIAPHDRSKYYVNDHPLHPRYVCPKAPCHNHEFVLPRRFCEQAKNWERDDQYCAVMKAIEPKEILEKVKKVMR